MAKALLHQERGHLHAAATVMTQHRNGLVTVELCNLSWEGVHGNFHQLKPLRGDASGLHLPDLTHS